MLITDGLVLDTDAKSVTVDGEPVKLTAIEFKIVRFLMENMGKIMSSNQIYEALWNEVPYSA